MSTRGTTIGVNAVNLRRGGGITHLVELLSAANPARFGIERVIVWGGKDLLSALPRRPWLIKSSFPAFKRGLLTRTVWQQFYLPKVAREEGCDVLFIPGGNYLGAFRPAVTMSRNMLPFEWRELLRFGFTLSTLRLLALRLLQARSFQKADGVIFLTDYAQKNVCVVTGQLSARVTTIPHGLNPRFRCQPKVQRPISDYDEASPFRILYVSIVDQHKHQWHVVDAVAELRRQGFPVVLDMVGPAESKSLRRLKRRMERRDSTNTWAFYHGPEDFNELHHRYQAADVGLFASSCENLPNILLEKMASGLPIACSSRGPMPEVLGPEAVYFDPERPEEIAAALMRLIGNNTLRHDLSKKSYARAQQYSWQLCSERTFEFLASFRGA